MTLIKIGRYTVRYTGIMTHDYHHSLSFYLNNKKRSQTKNKRNVRTCERVRTDLRTINISIIGNFEIRTCNLVLN